MSMTMFSSYATLNTSMPMPINTYGIGHQYMSITVSYR
jgi:hypothetical protein